MEPSQGCSRQSPAETGRLCFHKGRSGAAGPEGCFCGDAKAPSEKRLFTNANWCLQRASWNLQEGALLLHRLDHGDDSEALPSPGL